MKKDIYKSFYDFEWEHRSHLTSALNIPIAGITVLGAAFAAMAQSFTYKDFLNLKYAFIGFSILSFISLAIVIIFLFRAFLGYTYKRIATPKKFDGYYKRLLEWHNKYANGKQSADDKFEIYFNQRVAEASEVNAGNNKRRSLNLNRANLTLAISLIFLAVTSIVYLSANITAPEKVHNIKIIKSSSHQQEKGKMLSEQENNDQDQNNNQTPPPEPEPEPPRNEDIKEYTQPKKDSTQLNENDN